MSGTAASEPPSVTLSFANNFWGKDDAGVIPMLDRMHNAKVTSDELKSFYAARAAIEDEYSRKLLNLSRKPLGSSESGTLRLSLDVIRAEIESMGKSHQSIAHQMKTELEEPLTAFAGGMKERRKIVQNGIEKLLKVKMQQTSAVNKTRDRYEQDCLKIKGFLAQAHMVMGHEERKNKARLEKTQIQLSTTSSEYETAVKVLEETTGRWNRDWKAACDKFQDLEEERIDYTKSSLWTFANIASTVCVSDDGSCEKMRLSLEDCDVEKDILSFIQDNTTGQEIPDPPKFINFCRGDADTASETSDEGNYSVAQWQRTMNPAYRASSPQPSVFESHHDPNNPLALELGLGGSKPVPLEDQIERTKHSRCTTHSSLRLREEYNRIHDWSRRKNKPARTINKVKFRTMTILWTSKPDIEVQPLQTSTAVTPTSRNTWGPASHRGQNENISPIKPLSKGLRGNLFSNNARSASPEPADPRANFQLNIGNNVFDVASPDALKQTSPKKSEPQTELDPIAQALAELKGVTKQSSLRVSADRYHGLATPAPPATPSIGATPPGSTPTPLTNAALSASQRGPPPSYEQPAPRQQPVSLSRLGAPQPAHTARAMKQTTERYVNQKVEMFNGGSTRPSTRGTTHSSHTSQKAPSRAPSPAPLRATTKPQNYGVPTGRGSYSSRGGSPAMHAAAPRAPSPQPQPQPAYAQTRPASRMTGPPSRAASPNPQFRQSYDRPGSSRSDMALQLAPSPAASERGEGSIYGGSVRGRGGSTQARPTSSYFADNRSDAGSSRVRSKSLAEPRQYNRDGRLILHYSFLSFTNSDPARAMYVYNAQIPEERSFAKGDILAVLRLQDDGWWEAEVVGRNERPGLVPSNYLQNC
ncbi:hypothetical protein B0J11DRAFT_422936 [Dendryphion nanum]|uniref:Uncharacterized protein n=1 Tax=Dendryphion nanum TaxID=256645 RepID=A0A9P9ELI7_9PLEO|nr:hypothetical protein B0J11DRAFT_422936 [Dendryphion nanum]